MRTNQVLPERAMDQGEAERALGMVDGVLLLVDAVDGVMPSTGPSSVSTTRSATTATPATRRRAAP